jgi:hypothetical protein
MHEASGAFAHDPQRKADRANEPIPTGPLGEPYKLLTDLEKSIWNELASSAPPGVLTNADRIMVEMTCRLIARDRDPVLRVNEPLKAAERVLIVSMLAKMGMSAADRSKIAVKNPRGPDAPATDTFSQLAARSRGRGPEDIQ